MAQSFGSPTVVQVMSLTMAAMKVQTLETKGIQHEKSSSYSAALNSEMYFINFIVKYCIKTLCALFHYNI